MIIVTGFGRSGTTLLAQIYDALGFDPGGELKEEVHGGLEDQQIRALNEALIKDVALVPHWGDPRGAASTLRQSLRRFVPRSARSYLRSGLAVLPGFSTSSVPQIQWKAIPSVVNRYGAELRRAAENKAVAKDPFFLMTLRIWAASGVPIEHVLISERALDAVVESHKRVGWFWFRSEDVARDYYCYLLGLTVTTIQDFGLPYNIVRFPDFLDRPEELFESMKFPKPVSREQFLDAVQRVKQPDLVHDRR